MLVNIIAVSLTSLARYLLLILTLNRQAVDHEGPSPHGGAGQCTDETVQTARDPMSLGASVPSLFIIFDKV